MKLTSENAVPSKDIAGYSIGIGEYLTSTSFSDNIGFL